MAKIATREAYGAALAELAQIKKNIVVLDADLAGSTKTAMVKKVCPDRHFNMGIAEANMMGVAAGLAASGKTVFASSFAMFATGRAFEQIRNSICYPAANVKICASHAGITVGEDGASHQTIEDISIMRSLPNMSVIHPCDAVQTKFMVRELTHIDGPCYLRLGRLAVDPVYDENTKFELGKGNVIQEGSKIAIITCGLMVQECLKARELFDFKPTIVDMHTIKPIDVELIKKLSATHDMIITVEEHSIIGGLGSAVAEVVVEKCPIRMHRIGLDDEFGTSGTPAELLAHFGLDAEHIAATVNECYKSL